MMDSLRETLDTGQTSCGFGALPLPLGASKAWTMKGFCVFASRKVFSFSHVKAKQDQECGGKYAEIPRDQHLVFLTSKQSKAKTSWDSKMADKTVVQEREIQCKARIKETSSAQCPVSLKGRRTYAPRGSTVPLQKNSEGVSSRLRHENEKFRPQMSMNHGEKTCNGRSFKHVPESPLLAPSSLVECS